MSEKFRYLKLIIQQEGEIGEDVNHRVQAGWVNRGVLQEYYMIGAFH